MARNWYVRQGAAVFGPFPSTQVQTLARDGRITPDTELSNAPGGPWHPAAAVRGLVFSTIPAAPPVIPPPLRRPPGPPPPQSVSFGSGVRRSCPTFARSSSARRFAGLWCPWGGRSGDT